MCVALLLDSQERGAQSHNSYERACPTLANPSRIAAAVAVLDDDPEIWSDGRRDAGYIHLLMVGRAHAGSGFGDAALAHAEEITRDRGGHLARLDAVASNAKMQDWYKQRGYRSVGIRAYDDEDLFDSVLLEKVLV